MALDRTIKKLHESQDDTTREVSLLRSQFKELAKEMKSDRLKFMEMMRESQAQTDGADSTEENADKKQEKTDRKEGNSTLKSILVGILGLGAALALFNKELNGLPGLFAKSIGDSIKGVLPDWMTGGAETAAATPSTLSVAGVTGASVAARKFGETASQKISEGVDEKTKQRARTQNQRAAVKNLKPEQKSALLREGVTVKEGQMFDKKDRLISGDKIDSTLKKVGADVADTRPAWTTSARGEVEKAVKKAGPKLVAKSVPFLGAIAGVGFSISRAIEGDYTGALLDLGAAGAAATGAGAPAAAALSVAALARDVYHATFPDEVLEQSLVDNPEETAAKFGTILEMVKSSIAELGGEDENTATRTSAANRRRAQRGQAPVGTFSSQTATSAETVTPVPGASTGLQIAPIIDGQTRESVATTGGAPNVTVVAPNTTNNTAVSGAGSAEPQQMAFNSTTRAAHNLDAYASPA